MRNLFYLDVTEAGPEATLTVPLRTSGTSGTLPKEIPTVEAPVWLSELHEYQRESTFGVPKAVSLGPKASPTRYPVLFSYST